MPIVISGTNGISGVDGTASTPSYEGTDSNTGIFFPAADTVAIGTGGSERVRVDSSGNLGIGTTSPDTRLTVLKNVNADFSSQAALRASALQTFSNSNTTTAIVFNGQSTNPDKFIAVDNLGGTQYFTLGYLSGSTRRNVIQFDQNDTIYLSTAGTERARIDSSGRLLINTAVAGSTERFRAVGATSGSSAFAARFSQTNYSDGYTTLIGLGVETSSWSKGAIGFVRTTAYDVGDLVFCLNSDAASGSDVSISNERARITSGGNLLINSVGGYQTALDKGITLVAGGYNDTTSKARVVHVGGVGDNGNRCGWTAYGIKTGGTGNGSQYYLRPVTWSGTAFAEQASAGVYLADNATSWTSASDERIKDIIEPIENAAAKVASLRAVIGKYKDDEEGTRRPFLIAQDVQAVLPEAIDVQEDELGTLGLAYTETIPLLVAAIKELKAELDATKAEVAALKGA